MIASMTKSQQRLLNRQLSNERGLLFACVRTERIDQIEFTVAERQLDGVTTDKGGIAVHVESSRTVGGNWVSAAEAALLGLHPAVRGDQVLIHALAFEQQVEAPAKNGGGEYPAKSHSATGSLRHLVQAEPNENRNQLKSLISDANPNEGSHGSCSLLLCGAALGLFDIGYWRVELAYRLDAGVSGEPLPDVPERVERNLGSGGEGLNLRVAQGSEVSPNLFGRG
jgi:hypothetical protein